MSWGNENEEIRSLKKALSTKDALYATLESELLKRTTQFNDIKSSLNETISKLQFEADRALKLESDLTRRSDELKHEQLNRQNAENALLSANDKIKTEERASRELQAIIDSLSYGAENFNVTHAKLLKERSLLECRVRELETEVKFSAPPPVVTQAPRSRLRSSSLSNLRITSLEDELAELRKSVGEMAPMKNMLSQTKGELIKVQNDKLALERRMQGRVRELEAALDEREEEMEYLKNQCRESEARLEDLESRKTDVADAEHLKTALVKAENELRLEKLRVADAEARHDVACRDVDEARREVHNLSDLLRQRAEVEKAQVTSEAGPTLHLPTSSISSYTTLSEPCHLEADTAASIARLLSAVDRLRAERNDLRRDLEFAQTEARFATDDRVAHARAEEDEKVHQAQQVSCLEHELMKTTAEMEGLCMELGRARTDLEVFAQKHNELVDARADMAYFKAETVRLGQAAASCAVLVMHSDSLVQAATSDRDYLQLRLEEALQRIDMVSKLLAETQTALEQGEDRQSIALASLDEAETHRAALMLRVADLEERLGSQTDDTTRITGTYDSTKDELSQTRERLHDVEKALENTEAERASIALQLMHAQAELTTAQQEASDAEERCRTQLLTLSGGEGSNVSKMLREQIDALEQRVLRRTEQIGIHQHDICRLETNLRLQEERVSELTAEAETAEAEKVAMLEDCASAREARDEAQLRVEGLEMEIEALGVRMEGMSSIAVELRGRLEDAQREEDRIQKSHTTELATVVHVLFDAVFCSRVAAKAVAALKTELETSGETVMAATERLRETDDKIASLQEHLSRLSCEGDERTGSLELLEGQLELAVTEAQQVSLALTIAREQLDDNIRTVQALKEEKTTLESSVADLQAQLSERAASTEQQLQDERRRHSRAEAELTAQMNEWQNRAQDAEHQCAQLEERHRIAIEDLIRAKEDAESRFSDAAQQLDAIHGLEAQIVQLRIDHAKELGELRGRCDDRIEDVRRLQLRLQDEIDGRMQDRNNYETGLSTTMERCESAEQTLAQTRQELTFARVDLDEADASLRSLQEEKTSLQAEITNLEADKQRFLSMQRYLENQIQHSERELTNLKAEVGKVRADYARSVQTGKTAEISLSLQATRYEQTITSLRRQLAEYPSLEETVAELRDANSEMEELLKLKCAEIEENDDRFIEMLIEKKKLTSRIESLNRKVQNLQTKLAAASTTSPVATSSRVIPDQRHSPPNDLPVPSIPSLPSTSSISQSVRQLVASPHRAVSSLPRPKTPEAKAVQPVVFRAKTPEVNRRAERPTPPSPPSSSAGRKRSAPDDFDPSEPLSAQAIVAESNTPRSRKSAHSLRSGFTPVRGSDARPILAKPSPLRRITTTMVPSIISDVTNSPRALSELSNHAKPPTRSWLGKIRGGIPSRPPTSRPPVFEKMYTGDR